MVAHHTYVQLIAGGPLATLYAGGGPPVAHQWQIPPADCRLRTTGGPPVAFVPLIAYIVGHWSDCLGELLTLQVSTYCLLSL